MILGTQFQGGLAVARYLIRRLWLLRSIFARLCRLTCRTHLVALSFFACFIFEHSLLAVVSVTESRYSLQGILADDSPEGIKLAVIYDHQLGKSHTVREGEVIGKESGYLVESIEQGQVILKLGVLRKVLFHGLARILPSYSDEAEPSDYQIYLEDSENLSELDVLFRIREELDKNRKKQLKEREQASRILRVVEVESLDEVLEAEVQEAAEEEETDLP